MKLNLPNPKEAARQQAEQIKADRKMTIDEPLRRVLSDNPYVDRESLLSGLVEFHKERMEKIPSPTKYPESVPWVEHILAVDKELKALANLSDQDMALLRSLGHYLCFRGFLLAKPKTAERCRVVYLPESDHGQFHIKNVDDPATNWTGYGDPPKKLPIDGTGLVWDGVGSGLHIDDEPKEIFPLLAWVMYQYYADDVPSAVEFLTRYSQFWGGGNCVLHDAKKRSVAIEKCSHNFIEVFYPGPDGRSHCSGMACRDAQSPQGKYQKVKRGQFLAMFDRPKDCCENAFWDACDRAERMLSEAVRKLGSPAKCDDLINLFLTPWPKGLSKCGTKVHRDQEPVEYTLVTHYTFIDEKKYVRWSRGVKDLKFPEKPDVYQF